MADQVVILKPFNPYSKGKVLTFPEGDQMLTRDQLIIAAQTEDKYHTVRKKDRLDLLAYNFYKENVPDAARYWWVLADANEIENPLDLSDLVGTNILIPNIFRVKLLL